MYINFAETLPRKLIWRRMCIVNVIITNTVLLQAVVITRVFLFPGNVFCDIMSASIKRLVISKLY